TVSLHGKGHKNAYSTNSTTTATVPVSGTGTTAGGATPGTLTANPSSINFGSLQVGSTNTLFEAVTNSGGSSVTISQATITGPGFSLSGLSLPMTLTAGQSVTFSLTFAPQFSTNVSGSISIASDASI